MVTQIMGGISVMLAVLTTPALALDLNSYRAQHGRPALSASSQLMGVAYAHAADLARHFFPVIPGRGR